ncbi:hypothetical protein PUN28_002155 [Cardiocondyla obscurior]|uniref:Uncharacterized protein n=1 Tax=Cardiocondyla obscurior TaxID=286306 RepID=A0AAW2GSQ0_9HYME
MAKKQKKIFLKFCNVHCAAFKIDAFRAYSKALYIHQTEIWPKNKKKSILKIGSITLCNAREMHWAYFKLSIYTCQPCEICIVRHSKWCIRAYSGHFIFIKPRYGPIQALYIHLKPRYGKKRKIVFKFGNISLYGQKTKKMVFKFGIMTLCGI